MTERAASNLSQFIIRDAELADIPALFQISVEVHQASYAQLIPAAHRVEFDARYTVSPQNEQRYTERMTAKLQNPAWRVWVAVDAKTNDIVGYTLARIKRPDLLQKRGLFVRSEYQGQGIGSRLFTVSLETIKSGTVRLSVIDTNERAIHLYKKRGFEVIGTDERDYFGATQIVMEYHK